MLGFNRFWLFILLKPLAYSVPRSPLRLRPLFRCFIFFHAFSQFTETLFNHFTHLGTYVFRVLRPPTYILLLCVCTAVSTYLVCTYDTTDVFILQYHCCCCSIPGRVYFRYTLRPSKTHIIMLSARTTPDPWPCSLSHPDLSPPNMIWTRLSVLLGADKCAWLSLPLRNGNDVILANLSRDGSWDVLFWLDSMLYPFLTPTGAGVPVFGYCPKIFVRPWYPLFIFVTRASCRDRFSGLVPNPCVGNNG